MKIDDKKINELLTRGVEKIYPSREFLEKELKSGRQLKVYTGYDPTAPTLHIGHGITLLKLRQFQELGHKVMMLIGDFTGMIGDPTDKLSARKQLTHEQVMENCKNYKKQASAILDFEGANPVLVKYNSKWLAEMKLKEVLELATVFTVQQMEVRDMFQERIKADKPIFLHEFLYPLMQAYDSVAMDVDGEVGGNDQTFNMLVGRDLLKIMKNKEKFVLTMRLLTDSSGVKMGKSEGNMIALSDSPEDMFGKVMSWPDEMIASGFELCTKANIPTKGQISAEPMKYKKLLSFEIVKTFLGEKSAKQGEKHFTNVIQSKNKPEEILEIKPSKDDILTVLVESKICSSRGEARRQIEQGGVKVNGKKLGRDAINRVCAKGDIIQKGARFFVRIK